MKLPPATDLVYYGSVDFAISESSAADYTVVLHAGMDKDGNLFVRQPARGRMGTDAIIRTIVEQMKQYHPVAFAIENVHISKTLGPLLTRAMRDAGTHVKLEPMTPHRDKLARSAVLQGMMQMGKVWFENSPFTNEVIVPELLAFPAGKHDDIVDALSQLCMMVDTMRRPHPAPAPRPSTAPEPGTYDWLQARTASRRHDDLRARHRPPPLRGRAR